MMMYNVVVITEVIKSGDYLNCFTHSPTLFPFFSPPTLSSPPLTQVQDCQLGEGEDEEIRAGESESYSL